MWQRWDNSELGHWWWTVDRWTLSAVLGLMTLGTLLMMAATPMVAQRLHLSALYFVQRYVILLLPCVMVLVALSMCPPRYIKRVAFGVFLVAYGLLLLTPWGGTEIKGAKRWISLGGGFSIQPSEFLKPTLSILTAWMLSIQAYQPSFPGRKIALGLYLAVVIPVSLQPDLGMTVVISCVWLSQFFLAGLPLIYVVGGVGAGALGLVGAYVMLPHVASRVDRFLHPETGDCYQVNQALEAFAQGGWWGQGPGEGTVKHHLPDAHADFIFAVIGEEFGTMACLLVVLIFALILGRGFFLTFKERHLFIIYGACGLLTQLGIQALVNMASALHLIPTKGMTLPFLSYGGSSCLALSVSMGMLMSLTRRKSTQTLI